MEISHKKTKLKITNLMLAIIFMGFIMLIFAIIFSPDRNEQIVDTLETFGVLFMILGLFVITFQYLMKERARLNK